MVFKSLLRRFPILVWLVLVGALASNSVGASVRRPESLQACTKAPATPQLVSPANHAVVDPDHIILTWSAVEDATEYTVQVCADSTCSFVTTDATTAATSFDLTATAGTMPADLCVYWRARAENDCGASAYTSAWTFCSPGELGTVTPTGSPTAGTPTETATPSTTPTPSTTATTYTTVSVTPTTSVTATPSTTPTSSVTATPSTTPTPSVTPTPSTTSTPSVTPTPSTTADSIYVFGEVRDAASNAALRDVVVSLYRSDVGDWRLISERTTDANGHYAFGFSLAPQAHRIVETDPPGYTSDRVAIPSSLSGTAIDANTVEFQPPANGSYGPLVFYDRGAGATPTATGTAALTGTPTATLTPTRSGDSARLWLPLLQNLFPH